MIAGGLPTIARRLLDVSLERRANWRDGSDFPGNGRLGDAGGALIGGQSSQVTSARGDGAGDAYGRVLEPVYGPLEARSS